ncbi:hypothetical protein [Steroidobacter cummioxidans]|uniref:hypothetical protein n=1 Tax=Steroidobacter cummioxidans TaxID=1803913 RepID=UPI0012907DBB|nr:hypothetical protein [Steroidobacter cummioxidans]
MNKAFPENIQAADWSPLFGPLYFLYCRLMATLDASVESRFTLLAKAMRTLVDLLHTEHGYARIFYDQDGYSYELHSYQHTPMADLFTCMLGYESATDATEAARDTLSAIHAGPRSRSSKGRARGRRLQQPETTQLILPVGVC